MINLIHFGGLGGHQTDYLNYFHSVLTSRFNVTVVLLSEKSSSSVKYDKFVKVSGYSYLTNVMECLKVCYRLKNCGSGYFFSNSNDNLLLIILSYIFISKKIVLFELFPLVEGVGLLRKCERILLYKFCKLVGISILTNVPISCISYKTKSHIFIGDPCLDSYFKDSLYSKPSRTNDHDLINILVFGAIDDRKNLEYLLSITEKARRENLVCVTVAGKIFSPSVGESLKNQKNIRIVSRYLSVSEVKSIFLSSHCLWINYKNFIYASGVLGLSCIYKRPVIFQDYGVIGSLCKQISVGCSVENLLADGSFSYRKISEMLDSDYRFLEMLSTLHKDVFNRNKIIIDVFNRFFD